MLNWKFVRKSARDDNPSHRCGSGSNPYAISRKVSTAGISCRKPNILGILLPDRHLPMLHTFIALVKKMGNSFGLIAQTGSKV